MNYKEYLATPRAQTARASDSAGAVTHGASLELRGISKHYPKQIAVESVDLDVRSGEFLTFLGPSGSGKTTTLNMVAGFVAPTSGSITMDGEDLVSLPPHRRGIGMVFQNYALFPHLTVAENIAFPLKQRKEDRATISREVGRVLELVNLTGYGDRLPKQLSGGQQQRVAFARAVVFKPRLLLMDEPLGALDKKMRDWLQGEIRAMHRELGITFLYVTHDQHEAVALSDRVAVFREGRIEQIDGPESLYRSPKTRFVADFLGEANLIVGAYSGDTLRGEGGFTFQVPSRHEVIDAEAVLMIRPENISVFASGHEPGPGRLVTHRGRVRDIIYQGATHRVEVALSDQVVLFANLLPREAAALVVGAEATVAWDPEDSVLLPA